MVIINLTGPFRKRDKFDTPEISEAKHIRDAAVTEHKIAKLMGIKASIIFMNKGKKGSSPLMPSESTAEVEI